jgi:hypothetical protein
MITINPALYITTLIFSTVMSYYIVISNYADNIYPINADSIGIPLFKTTGVTVILLLLSLIQYPIYKHLKHGKPSNIIAITSALAATTFSSALLFLSTAYWLAPNHFTLSAVYFITLSTYLTQQFKIYKSLVSRINQTPRTGNY